MTNGDDRSGAGKRRIFLIFCKSGPGMQLFLDFMQIAKKVFTEVGNSAKSRSASLKTSFESAVPRSKFVVEPIKTENYESNFAQIGRSLHPPVFFCHFLHHVQEKRRSGTFGNLPTGYRV
jgi:hypothetical protein